MADMFVVKLKSQVSTEADVWVLLERIEAAIREEQPEAGKLEHLSASDANGRTVERANFSVLRAALDAANVQPRSCDVWISVRKNGDWHLLGWWSRPSGPFEVEFSFGDRDRLRTESDAERVARRLEGHGYVVTRSETKVRSTDRGDSGPIDELKAKSRLAWKWVGGVLTALFVTVVGGLILNAIAAPYAPAPSGSPSQSHTASP